MIKIGDYRLKPAKLADKNALAKLHVKSWEETYRGLLADDLLDYATVERRKDFWQDALERNLYDVFILTNKNRNPVGFVGGQMLKTEDDTGQTADLTMLYLLQKSQGEGLGKAMFTHIAQHFSQRGFVAMQIAVLDGNKSQAFYEKMGGEHIETRAIEGDSQGSKEHIYEWSLPL